MPAVRWPILRNAPPFQVETRGSESHDFHRDISRQAATKPELKPRLPEAPGHLRPGPALLGSECRPHPAVRASFCSVRRSEQSRSKQPWLGGVLPGLEVVRCITGSSRGPPGGPQRDRAAEMELHEITDATGRGKNSGFNRSPY